MTIILVYVVLYLFALSAENATKENKRRLLILTCAVLAVLAGVRDDSWDDTGVYRMGFVDYTPSFGLML